MLNKLYELLEQYRVLKSRHYKLILKRNNIKLWVGEETMGTAIILSIIGMGLWLWPVFFLRFLIVSIPKLILHIRIKINDKKSFLMASQIDSVLDSIRNEKEIEAKEIIKSLSEKYFTSSSIDRVATEINQIITLWLSHAPNTDEFNLIINKSNLKFMFFGKAIDDCPDEIVIEYSKYNLPTLYADEEYFALGTIILNSLSKLVNKKISLYTKYQDLYFSKKVEKDRTTFLHRYSPYQYDGFNLLNEDLFITKLAYRLMCSSIECDKHDAQFECAEFNIKFAD